MGLIWQRFLHIIRQNRKQIKIIDNMKSPIDDTIKCYDCHDIIISFHKAVRSRVKLEMD